MEAERMPQIKSDAAALPFSLQMMRSGKERVLKPETTPRHSRKKATSTLNPGPKKRGGRRGGSEGWSLDFFRLRNVRRMGKNGISDEEKDWEGRYRSHENTPKLRCDATHGHVSPQLLPFLYVAPHPKVMNSFVTSLWDRFNAMGTRKLFSGVEWCGNVEVDVDWILIES